MLSVPKESTDGSRRALTRGGVGIYLWTGDVDSGRIAFGDARAIGLATEAEPGLVSSFDDGTAFAVRANYVVYRQPGGDWPYGVAVTPADETVQLGSCTDLRRT